MDWVRTRAADRANMIAVVCDVWDAGVAMMKFVELLPRRKVAAQCIHAVVPSADQSEPCRLGV